MEASPSTPGGSKRRRRRRSQRFSFSKRQPAKPGLFSSRAVEINSDISKGTGTGTGLPEPETTAEVQEPETAPEVKESGNTPEVKESGNTPEVNETQTTPEVNEHEITPEVTEPETTAEVQEPENTPEVNEPETTPEVNEQEITPEVKEPETTAEVTEDSYHRVETNMKADQLFETTDMDISGSEASFNEVDEGEEKFQSPVFGYQVRSDDVLMEMLNQVGNHCMRCLSPVKPDEMVLSESGNFTCMRCFINASDDTDDSNSNQDPAEPTETDVPFPDRGQSQVGIRHGHEEYKTDFTISDELSLEGCPPYILEIQFKSPIP